MTTTSISRRIEKLISCMESGDFESASLNYFPALDKTAKDSYPNEKKVGNRIRKFINEHEGLITFIATKNAWIDCEIGGKRLSEIIYTYGRCSIMHEGELDPRLTFDTNGQLQMGESGWSLTPDFLIALAISVILSPTNSKERISDHQGIVLHGKQYKVNELWGQRDKFITQPGYREMECLYRKL